MRALWWAAPLIFSSTLALSSCAGPEPSAEEVHPALAGSPTAEADGRERASTAPLESLSLVQALGLLEAEHPELAGLDHVRAVAVVALRKQGFAALEGPSVLVVGQGRSPTVVG